MSAEKYFLDTNVVLYLVSGESKKADLADELVNRGAVISVQVLNECVAVARRKWKLPWNEIHLLLGYLQSSCHIVPLAISMHERAVDISEATGIRIYDALLVAAAEDAGCDTLFTEDLNNGQRIGSVAIRNPFMPA